MREYGKVSPQFWIGETGKALRGNPEAQILALYLMTNPHATMTGVFHCPIIYMAHETGLMIEGASKGLARLIEVSFCEYDEASESVFVINMASHQIDDELKPGDKRVLGLKKYVQNMTPARFKSRFIEVYGERFHLQNLLEKASPLQAPCKPLRSQEQEQEQDINNAPRFVFKAALLDAGAKPELVDDWLKVRKAKRAANTKTAFDGFMREVSKSGLAVDQVLEVCCKRSWQGFEADWVKDIKPSADDKPKLDTSLEARRAAMQAQADESYKNRAWLDGEKRYRTVFKIEDGQVKSSRVYDSGVAA